MWLRRDVLKAALLGLIGRWDWRYWAKRQERRPMAAIEARWHASTGVFDHGPNWDGGVVPGAGVDSDTAICDGVSQQAFTTNLDRNADFPLHRFVTMPAYGGNLGSSGTHLLLGLTSDSVATSRVVHRGTGQFFYEGESGNVQDVYVDSARPMHTPAMTIYGEVRNIFVRRGYVEIASTCSVTGTIWCAGVGAKVMQRARDTTEDIPIRLLCTAGEFYNYRLTSATAGNLIIVVGGGRMWQYGRVQDATAIYDFAGGGFWMEPSEAPTAAHNPDLFVDSRFDMSASPYDVEFDDLIIGPNAAILGGALHTSGVYSPLSAEIDMREEYP